MDTKGLDALKAKFADIDLKPNAKTMEEVVAYIEEKWGAQRVKILESEYIVHYKNAMEFMQRLGKSTEGVQEEIRRYRLPNKICIVLGMQSEYMTAENGMKYYQALTLLKGLTQEDIDTKNDRWLQYVLLLSMQQDWEAKEKEFLAEQEAARKALEEQA
ncbi:MAG: hypothetical protein IKI88_03380 [Anaerotignum sp.]|nr:hypothetical protein [Anaerotignum sp.]